MSAPTERPIMFAAPMVRALLDGRKTQTRRLATSPLAKAQPGDTLWVREAGNWQVSGTCVITGREMRCVAYAASADPSAFGFFGGRKRPSIHMPRWASRITLTVTDARREWLLDISEADAMAEGVEPLLVPPDGGSAPHAEGFMALWDTLHGDGSAAANPEIVALTFTVALPGGDA